MLQVIEANWMVLAAVLVAALLVAWWLFGRATSAPPRRDYKPDVLDEGVGPAQRNQALIDAAPAAQIITPLPGAGIMAGIGEIVAVAAQDEVEELAAAHAEAGDDLSRIKGLGPKLQALLPTLGITTFAQIAALDEAGLVALDAKLGAFAGRPAKDAWVEQARLLAAGDVAGFEERFGKV
jgi:predicted flap endonuclease-1-like 5' DNA nuclease